MVQVRGRDPCCFRSNLVTADNVHPLLCSPSTSHTRLVHLLFIAYSPIIVGHAYIIDVKSYFRSVCSPSPTHSPPLACCTCSLSLSLSLSFCGQFDGHFFLSAFACLLHANPQSLILLFICLLHSILIIIIIMTIIRLLFLFLTLFDQIKLSSSFNLMAFSDSFWCLAEPTLTFLIDAVSIHCLPTQTPIYS
jgi:hypothetical protein